MNLPVDSYIYRFLKENNLQMLGEYNLNPFFMNVQEIDYEQAIEAVNEIACSGMFE